MLEISAFLVLLFTVAGLYLVFERAINERSETVAVRAMESALGSGKRVTVSVGNGGQFPVRVCVVLVLVLLGLFRRMGRSRLLQLLRLL